MDGVNGVGDSSAAPGKKATKPGVPQENQTQNQATAQGQSEKVNEIRN